MRSATPVGRLTLFLKDTALGGAEISLLHLLSFLRSRSWRTAVVTHRQGETFQRFCDLTDLQLTVGFPYPRQPGSWPRLLPYILRARGVVAKNKPGVLLSGDFYTLWAALFLRTAQTPV